MTIWSIINLQPKPTCSSQGDPTFPRRLHHRGAVDGWPEAPDVVPVDPERGENIGLVEEISNHSGRSQQVLNSHHLVFNN